MTTTPAPRLDSPRGWVAVAGGFAAMFTAFGIAYSFGAFLGPMADEFDTGRGAIAGVFALTSLTYFGLGALSGAAVDRYGPRVVLLVGAAALGVGLVAASRSSTLVLTLVTYGLGVGIGVACAYVPMVAVVGGWFERRRTLAIGIAVTGIGLGTLAVAPLAAALIESTGWRDAYLILGLSGAGVLVVCAFVVAQPPTPAAAGQLRIADAIRDPGYRRMYVAIALMGVVLFVPFVHLPDYAEQDGSSPVAAAALVGIIGAASIVGRLALGPVADRVGLLRAFQWCFAAMASSFVLWLTGLGYGVLVVFAVVLGVGYGGFVALGPAVVAERFGTASLGGVLGVLYTSAGLGSALGAPAAGVLIDSTDSFQPAIVACLVIGLTSVAVIRRV